MQNSGIAAIRRKKRSAATATERIWQKNGGRNMEATFSRSDPGPHVSAITFFCHIVSAWRKTLLFWQELRLLLHNRLFLVPFAPFCGHFRARRWHWFPPGPDCELASPETLKPARMHEVHLSGVGTARPQFLPLSPGNRLGRAVPTASCIRADGLRICIKLVQKRTDRRAGCPSQPRPRTGTSGAPARHAMDCAVPARATLKSSLWTIWAWVAPSSRFSLIRRRSCLGKGVGCA